MKQKHRFASYFGLVVLLIGFSLVTKYYPSLMKYASPQNLREILLSAGGWGYLLFIGLLIASIPLPIPSTPVVLSGGYVYGILLGSGLALVANVIGSSIAFLLIRYAGRPLLEKLVDEHHITHFSKMFKKRGNAAALISFAIPLFPSDAVSMILGLTRVKYRVFFWLALFGHIPRYLILNSVGADIFAGFTMSSILVIAGAGVFILISVFREKIRKFLFKEIKELEKEVVM